jgi:hypothetical protein
MNKYKKVQNVLKTKSTNKWAALALLIFTPLVHADDTYSSYDDIVRDLSTSTSYQTSTATNKEELIRFHTSFGLITNYIGLNLPKGLPNSASLSGYEFRLGIDLFSQNWISYGTIRSYDPENFRSGQIEMKEFDLMVVYNDAIRGSFRYSIGGGMTSRYLDFIGTFSERFNRKNSTPASVILLGLDSKISRPLSAGLTMTYRSPLISETIDNGGWDGNVHLSAQF